jgi:O-antigen/teichoic acid export membrane protein
MTVLSGKRELFKDGAWASIGQIGSVMGTVVGTRVLTEFVAPEIFGSLTLILGVIALALGTLVSPVMQAALRFYPEYSGGRASLLRANILSILSKRFIIFLVTVALISPLAIYFTAIHLPIIFLCLFLLVLDSIRILETTLLNAARKQTTFALISIGEAWGRPFVAVFLIHISGINVESILTAYALTSASILFLFYRVAKLERVSIGSVEVRNLIDLKGAIKQYSSPLTPMAILGWMNGVGDRYVIGALLGIEQAGIYAAVYGLVSRPFLMASGIVELTLRPIYNQLVVKHMHKDADRLLIKWLLTVMLLVGVGFILIVIFDHYIIFVLLAEKYRSGVMLMPWIAGGYALLALSDVFIKVCYAYGYTRRVLMVQIIGALVSLALSVVGIKLYGLIGAAMAVPAYFGLMLLITVFVSRLNIQKKKN